jgi:hypothetical protein
LAKIGRCPAQDLALLAQVQVLLAQPLQLDTLGLVQRARFGVASVAAALVAHPVAERLVLDPEVTRDGRHRLVRGRDEHGGLVSELLGVRASHAAPLLVDDRPLSGVHESGSTPLAGASTTAIARATGMSTSSASKIRAGKAGAASEMVGSAA